LDSGGRLDSAGVHVGAAWIPAGQPCDVSQEDSLKRREIVIVKCIAATKPYPRSDWEGPMPLEIPADQTQFTNAHRRTSSPQPPLATTLQASSFKFKMSVVGNINRTAPSCPPPPLASRIRDQGH
jgi:hypothetical protein